MTVPEALIEDLSCSGEELIVKYRGKIYCYLDKKEIQATNDFFLEEALKIHHYGICQCGPGDLHCSCPAAGAIYLDGTDIYVNGSCYPNLDSRESRIVNDFLTFIRDRDNVEIERIKSNLLEESKKDPKFYVYKHGVWDPVILFHSNYV